MFFKVTVKGRGISSSFSMELYLDYRYGSGGWIIIRERKLSLCVCVCECGEVRGWSLPSEEVDSFLTVKRGIGISNIGEGCTRPLIIQTGIRPDPVGCTSSLFHYTSFTLLFQGAAALQKFTQWSLSLSIPFCLSTGHLYFLIFKIINVICYKFNINLIVKENWVGECIFVRGQPSKGE